MQDTTSFMHSDNYDSVDSIVIQDAEHKYGTYFSHWQFLTYFL